MIRSSVLHQHSLFYIISTIYYRSNFENVGLVSNSSIGWWVHTPQMGTAADRESWKAGQLDSSWLYNPADTSQTHGPLGG